MMARPVGALEMEGLLDLASTQLRARKRTSSVASSPRTGKAKGRGEDAVAAALSPAVVKRLRHELTGRAGKAGAVNQPDRQGRTLLVRAVQAESPPLIHVLLSVRGCDPDRCDRLGRTALHHAIAAQSVPAICALLTHPTNKASATVADSYSRTPISMALEKPPSLVAAIVAGVGADEARPFLAAALQHDRAQTVKAVLEAAPAATEMATEMAAMPASASAPLGDCGARRVLAEHLEAVRAEEEATAEAARREAAAARIQVWARRRAAVAAAQRELAARRAERERAQRLATFLALVRAQKFAEAEAVLDSDPGLDLNALTLSAPRLGRLAEGGENPSTTRASLLADLYQVPNGAGRPLCLSMLARGADLVTHRDVATRNTVLHLAVAAGDIPTLEALRAHVLKPQAAPGDPAQPPPPSRPKNPWLHLCRLRNAHMNGALALCRPEDDATFRWMVTSHDAMLEADVSNRYSTPLVFALQSPKMHHHVSWLLERKANPNAHGRAANCVELAAASAEGDAIALLTMLKEAGADLESPGPRGRNAFELTMQSRNQEAVIDFLFANDAVTRHPLYYRLAAERHDLVLLERLVEHRKALAVAAVGCNEFGRAEELLANRLGLDDARITDGIADAAGDWAPAVAMLECLRGYGVRPSAICLRTIARGAMTTRGPEDDSADGAEAGKSTPAAASTTTDKDATTTSKDATTTPAATTAAEPDLGLHYLRQVFEEEVELVLAAGRGCKKKKVSAADQTRLTALLLGVYDSSLGPKQQGPPHRVLEITSQGPGRRHPGRPARAKPLYPVGHKLGRRQTAVATALLGCPALNNAIAKAVVQEKAGALEASDAMAWFTGECVALSRTSGTPTLERAHEAALMVGLRATSDTALSRVALPVLARLVRTAPLLFRNAEHVQQHMSTAAAFLAESAMVAVAVEVLSGLFDLDKQHTALAKKSGLIKACVPVLCDTRTSRSSVMCREATQALVKGYLTAFLECVVCGEFMAKPVPCRKDSGQEHYKKLACPHVFCGNCLEQWVKACVSELNTAIRCPMPDCKFVLYPDDVLRCVGDNAELKEQYTKLIRADYGKRSAEMRRGMSEFVARNTATCPRCLVIIERSAGCDSMRCICGQTFNYKKHRNTAASK